MKALARYKKMRDFAATPEPSGGSRARARRGGALSFVIQRHDATRLHYDLRLELDGVLKSWAVPKGPSLVPGDKRLAVETEDHPLEYGTFEGAIPEGHYGAGHVLLWDRGTWEPEGDPHAGLKKGRLSFTLHGEKVNGAFTLVRTQAKGTKNQWLLLKRTDEHAQTRDLPDVTAPAPVLSLDDLTPELATLESSLPAGEEWIFEPKLDGYRALASLEDGEVKMVSRSGQDWTRTYRKIAQAIGALKIQSAVFDGEVCALDESGKPSFQLMQNALSGQGDLVYFIFDLLFVDGFDVRDRPLEKRKDMLASILANVKAPLSYVAHVEDGEELFDLACRGGMEGVVAKKRSSAYVEKRTRDWLKIKCQQRQEMVIVGYTKPKGSRSGLGALLLGVNDDEGLRYAGKVGTGFNAKTLDMLAKKLKPLAVDRSAARDAPKMRDATWVEPKLVCEVTFAEWTKDGALRHPVFVGLREDKAAKKVVKEAPATKAAPPAKKSAKKGSKEVAGVSISNPDRVLDSRSGITKLELAQFQASVADVLMPYISRRPLALVRCPEGDQGESFFQKQRTPGMPESIRGDRIEPHGVLYVEDPHGLVSLIQFGTVEIHGWGSRMDAPSKPDWIVMDLDPDEKLPFPEVVDAALFTRDLLKRLGLTSFVKTTGGKGLHVVAPIVARYDFEQIKALTHAISAMMEQAEPKRFTSNMAKSARPGRIFVDYLRNGHGATAIMPYSARARPGATVAYPVAWRDLTCVDPQEFSVKTVPALLKKRKIDPWAQMLSLAQEVPKAFAEHMSKNEAPKKVAPRRKKDKG